MAGIIGLIILIGVIWVWGAIVQKAKDVTGVTRLEDSIDRRIAESSERRAERKLGAQLAEGWSIRFLHASSEQAIDCCVSTVAASMPAVTLSRYTGGVTLYGNSLRCELGAEDDAQGTLVTFRVVENPMTAAANRDAKQLTEKVLEGFRRPVSSQNSGALPDWQGGGPSPWANGDYDA